jgi:hypothetical protein
VIAFETMEYVQSSSRDDCSDSSSFVEVVMDTPNEISSQQWASTHWPADTTTAASVLLENAKLAHGLSGRTLKRLVTYARYEYVTDEPGDLRDMLVALEAVIRERVGQREREKAPTEIPGSRTEGREPQAEGVEMMDHEAFIYRLENGLLDV